MINTSPYAYTSITSSQNTNSSNSIGGGGISGNLSNNANKIPSKASLTSTLTSLQQKQLSTNSKTDDSNLFPLENEQISKLFPKCRPRACDINLNPVGVEPGSAISKMNANKGDQGQSKRYPVGSSYQPNPYVNLYKEVDVSLREMRHQRTPNTTPASTVLNSPDLSDLEPLPKHHYLSGGGGPGGHSYYHHSAGQIKVGRSPVENCSMDSVMESYSAPSPISPTTSMQNLQQGQQHEEVVVFDDIGDSNWSSRNLSSPIISDNEIRQMKQRYIKESFSLDDFKQRGGAEERDGGRTQKVIGGLQIADYEGSPRRFGASVHTSSNHQSSMQQTSSRPPNAKALLTSPSMFPPRPGFPKRVMSSYQMQVAATSPPNNNLAEMQHAPDSPPPLTQQSSGNLSGFDLLSDQPPGDDLVGSLFGGGNSNPCGGGGGLVGLDLTSTSITNSQSMSNNLSALLTSSTASPPLDVLTQSMPASQQKPLSFDYLYEFSETRKVLEEFFTCQTSNDKLLEKLSDFNESDNGGGYDSIVTAQDEIIVTSGSGSNHYYGSSDANTNASYIGHRLANKFPPPVDEFGSNRRVHEDIYEHQDIELFLDSGSRSSGELADNEVEHNADGHTRNFTLSPETTDYDSNCGDLDSEVSLRYTGLGGEFGLPNDVNGCVPNFARIYNSMPVLEDGLSSGHASDTENNNPNTAGTISMLMDQCKIVDPTTTTTTTATDKYIDSVLDSPQTLISTIQSTVSNSKQVLARNGAAGVNYGGLDIIDAANNCGGVRKENLITNSSPIVTTTSPIAASGGAQNVAQQPLMVANPSAAAAVALNMAKRQAANNLNILSAVVTQSQNASPIAVKNASALHVQELSSQIAQNNLNNKQQQQNVVKNTDIDLDTLYSINVQDSTPPPPAPVPHRKTSPYAVGSGVVSAPDAATASPDVQITLKDIRTTLQKTQKLPLTAAATAHETSGGLSDNPVSPEPASPVWIPRHQENSRESFDSDQPSKLLSADEEEADTDLETDRLLGQQRLDDQGFYDEKNWSERRLRTVRSPLTSKPSPQSITNVTSTTSQSCNNTVVAAVAATTTVSAASAAVANKNHTAIRQGVGTTLSPSKVHGTGSCNNDDLSSPSHKVQLQKSPAGSVDSSKKDDERGGKGSKNKNKEGPFEPSVLIEGVLFRARYLGSTQLVCEGQPTKSTRMMQAEEAVSRIKAPEGESQPSTEVDLFISTEKIMVLNTDLKEIMMDHALRTISYIADIGDLVVLMARRRFVSQQDSEAANNESNATTGGKANRTPKMICHVFESEEAQFIAQSIGQAFQVAYMEFLKANGIEDHSFMKEMDYQEVLNSQEIFGDELEIFAKKELQKEVVVPKAKGEILGVVIVESGWGSMLPTVVIANLASNGAAARCGQLNIGDQIIAINGLSLVGLPLSTCQGYIKNTKNQTAVKFTVVPCAPVVEVKIKRPNTKYQLGFSVQNGVICSLLRGGIAERGGVRVGHRIIEINNQSVVAVPHEKIVNLLATSVGEILMKTMPTSMFRLLTGQENPVYI